MDGWKTVQGWLIDGCVRLGYGISSVQEVTVNQSLYEAAKAWSDVSVKLTLLWAQCVWRWMENATGMAD